MQTPLEKIAQLESLEDVAVESITVDGTTTRFNLAHAAKRRRELQQQDPELRKRKPRIATMRLDTAF